MSKTFSEQLREILFDLHIEEINEQDAEVQILRLVVDRDLELKHEKD